MCVWTSITQCAERPKKRFTRHWQTGSGRDRASSRARRHAIARRASRARRRRVGPRAGPTSSARPGSTEDVLGPCSCRKRSALVRCANSTVRLQCARPFTTDTLGAAAYRKAYYTHCTQLTTWSARHVYPRRTILSPGFKTVSKVTLGRPPAPVASVGRAVAAGARGVAGVGSEQARRRARVEP